MASPRDITKIIPYPWEGDIVKRQQGECCQNCIETTGPDFSGACVYAGEIAGWYWCEHYIRGCPSRCTTCYPDTKRKCDNAITT